MSPSHQLFNLRACRSTKEDLLSPLQKHRILILCNSEAGDAALRRPRGLSGSLLLALGLMKPSDLFFNSSFFLKKRKAALIEAFKIQELWIPLLCQAKWIHLSGFIKRKNAYTYEGFKN